jgi:hypothetical protein
MDDLPKIRWIVLVAHNDDMQDTGRAENSRYTIRIVFVDVFLDGSIHCTPMSDMRMQGTGVK